MEQQVNQSTGSIEDQQLENRIIAFRDKMDLIRENPTLKSGNDPMEVDSAVWFIEATSNLTYGDASSTLEDYVIDSAFIEVPLTNGQIQWVDVQVAYDQVIDSLSDHYASIPSDEKQLIVADISLKETSDNTVTLEVLSGFGADALGCGLGISNNSSWYWGYEQGRCDGSGLGTGCDAADKIAQLANYNIAVPTSGYYTDVTYQEVWYDAVPTSSSNPYGYGDYLLYQYYQEVTPDECMSTGAINYYKNGLYSIGNIYKPTGSSIIRYFLWDDAATGITPTGLDSYYEVHVAKIKYAIWHPNGTPPDDL